MYGLGRRHAPDERDKLHLMTAHIPAALPSYRYWIPGAVLNQGQTSQCVGYAWAAWLGGSPVRTRTVSPSDIYHAAQLIDEWPGEDYDGTSVRAGSKVLAGQGRIGEYVWASHAAELRDWILGRSGAVIGINWYDQMFTPDANGYIHPGGSIAGGHAIYVYGYSTKRAAFRLQNSWGLDWGVNGRCWLKMQDMATLLNEQGEACGAIEVSA